MGSTHSARIKRAASGKVRVLKFRRKRLPNQDLEALAVALMSPDNRVTSLEFNGSSLGPRGLSLLADAMEHPNCRVVRLCIFNEHLGPVGARVLARLICQTKRPLLSLIMENNILASEGAVILADALKQPGNRLHVLYLLSNHIGHDGVIALCDALKHENNRVAEISLTGNYLGFDSLVELANVIKHKNNKLEYLRFLALLQAGSIKINRIDNRGACILSRAMVADTSKIRSLDLESNLINDTRDLTRCMKISKLQWVDVSFNNDNPYDQTRMFCDIRLIFFEKRRYWRSILAMCCARDAQSVMRRFMDRMAGIPEGGIVPDHQVLKDEHTTIKSFGKSKVNVMSSSTASGWILSPSNTGGHLQVKVKRTCWLCLLPKDLVKLVAAAAYPWAKTEKMLLGFVYL